MIVTSRSSFVIPLQDPLKSARSFATLELWQVEVGRGDLEKPFRLNNRTCADIVSRCQHELIVEYPVRSAVNHCAWVNHDDLIIFQCLIVTRSLQKRRLHEVTWQHCLLNICVVVRVRHWLALQTPAMVRQDPDQLISDIIWLLESAEIQITIPAPVRVHVLRFERVERVQQGDVITILVSKLCLLSVRNLGLVPRSNEDVWHVETGNDC